MLWPHQVNIIFSKVEIQKAEARGSMGWWKHIDLGTRQILIFITKLILHVLGSLLKILLRKGNSYLFLKKRNSSRNGVGTD